jgi:hypothetical protein
METTSSRQGADDYETMSGLWQMGGGSGSIPQAQTSVVADIDSAFGYSGSSSEQATTCELVEKEALMVNQSTTICKAGVVRISVKVTFKQVVSCLIMAGLLMFGYGDGLSPSAITHSFLQNRSC